MQQMFIGLIALTLIGLSYGDPLILADRGQYRLAPHALYYIDTSNSLSVDELLKNDSTIPWETNGKDDPNFGFLSHPVWLKIPIVNQNANIDEWAIEIAYPQLDAVDVYFVGANGTLINHFTGGDSRSVSSQLFNHPHIVFPAELFPYEPVTLYLKVQTEGANQIPISLWQWDAFNFHSLTHFLVQGLFYGMVLIMAMYNFVVWTTERQSIYLSYAVYIIFFTIFQTSISGIGFQYVWPNHAWLNQYITPVSLSLLLASLSLFIRSFFDTQTRFLKMDKVLVYSIFTCTVMAFISIPLPYHYAILICALITSMFALYVIFIAFYMLKVNHPSSRYFALAWGIFIGGAILLTANKFGFIPITSASEYGLQFGAGLEIMFLSLALADRMARTQKDKIKAQEKALALASKVSEEQERTFNMEIKTLRLEKQATEKLEQEVEERTAELKSALEKLSIAHDKLQTISITDALTELNNRYYFNEHWKIEFKRAYRDDTELAIIMMDIDHFKKVNDTYGHPAGDACLKQVADCIRSHASRESDICCRYGGEEFAIILPATPVLGALEVAENIRLDIENMEVNWEQLSFKVTASFGISGGTPKATNTHNRQFFINQADQALYQAKHQGRNQTVIFTQDVL